MWPVSCEYLNVPICMVSALPMYSFISPIWKSRWKLRFYWIPLPVSPLLWQGNSRRLFLRKSWPTIMTLRQRERKWNGWKPINALQVKYAYGVTCHKAQGGQWKHVYVDMGYIPQGAVSLDFYRWLYTAFTRATEKIWLVNMSEEFRESSL